MQKILTHSDYKVSTLGQFDLCTWTILCAVFEFAQPGVHRKLYCADLNRLNVSPRRSPIPSMKSSPPSIRPHAKANFYNKPPPLEYAPIRLHQILR